MPAAAPPKPLTLINLYGAPGVGKSSVAAGLFFLMKSHHLSVEHISEYAKYLIHSHRDWQLRDEQLYLLAKQHHKQLILRGRYDYAVTDSPLLLTAFYAPKTYHGHFEPLVNELDGQFEHINIFMTRSMADGAPYQNEGRVHDRRASAALELEMRDFLHARGVRFSEVPVDVYAPWRILEMIRPGLAAWPTFKPRLVEDET